MANFHRKIPLELKVSLQSDVNRDAIFPSVAYRQLMNHFEKIDPYLHDKLRLKLELRAIGNSEKVAKFMK